MAFKFDFSFESELDKSSATDDPSEDVTPPASASNYKPALPLDGLEEDISHLQLSEANAAVAVAEDGQASGKFQEITLDELIDHLPPALSYSPCTIPLTSSGIPTNQSTTLLRRDLFDARFQLLNEEDDSDDDGSAYGNSVPRNVSPPKGLGGGTDSDLIKGVYEGGLKTWEASLDLVDCLHEQGYKEGGKSIRGQRVLEVGCGTALPSIYLLELLFKELLQEEQDAQQRKQTERSSSEKTVIHLQDYNPEVLLYITFCNVILAFWNARQSLAPSSSSSSDPTSSTASLPSSSTKPTPKQPKPKGEISQDIQYTVDHDPETELNELELNPELIESFTSFLAKHNVDMKFSSGDWQRFPSPPELPYSVILTSETVYELDNLPHLVNLLERAGTSFSHSGKDTTEKEQENMVEQQLTLVACKRVYFGVGGGEVAFKEQVQKKRKEAEVENVWNSKRGVETTVMRVTWA